MPKRLAGLVTGLGLMVGFWSMFLEAAPRYLDPYPAPAIDETIWFNSQPLRLAGLAGQVVLVEFWTYGCYNCRNVEPHIRKWYQAYHSRGLEIIAVHSPEFDWERKPDNVRAYVRKRGIRYPVVLDNDFRIWRTWSNHYWPALYLVDKQGRVRYRQIGEGAYERTEAMIRQLLAEPAGRE
jgi:thiol-disulfide isomerase/thioredoxin